MSDVGLVGTGKVRIEPDFTGFAQIFRTRIQPIIRQAAAGVTDIDKALASTVRTANTLATSMGKASTASTKLADSLRAVAAVDLDDSSLRLAAALQRATPAASDLAKQMTGVRSGFTGAANSAVKLDGALDSIDGRDLANVATAAQAASTSLQSMAASATVTDTALASIDSTDLRGVTLAATQASTALGSTAATATAAGGATSAGFTNAATASHGLRTAVLGTAVAFGGLAIGSGLAIKSAIDFESAFAGVTKTVDGTQQELDAIRQGIIDLSKVVPASTTEIAAVAEAAGQLGIATPNILDFTKVMIDLGESTNLSATDAASALARIANITQLPQDQFDELGSTIVDLGNNLATTEAEITEMALRIAGAGNIVGLTQSEIVSFAAALSSVGINAEAGGSAISRTFIDMADAVNSGGEELATFARVAGTDVANFSYMFKTDAAGAVLAFVEGLGRMNESGQDVFGVLSDLGLEEIRQRDALLRAAGAGDLFRESLAFGSQAWRENTALTNEASKRYATVASQLEMLKNTTLETARQVGQELMPSFLAAASAVQQSLVPALADLTSTVGPVFAEVLGSLGTAFAPLVRELGPVLAALGNQLLPIIESLTPHIGTLAATFGGSLVRVVEAAGPAFVRLVEAAGPLLPLFATLAAGVLERLTPLLIALVDAVVPLAAAFASLIEPVTQNETAMTLLAVAVGAAIAVFAAVQLAPVIAALGSLATAVGAAVTGMTSFNAVLLFAQGAIGAVLGPVVLVIAAVAALGAAVYAAYQNIEPFRNAVDAVGRFIRDTAVAAFEKLSDIIGNSLVPWLRTLADTAYKTFVENIQPALTELVGAFSELWDQLVTIGQPIVQWIIDHWQIVAGVFLAVTSPIGAVIAGVVALYTQFEPFRDLVGGVVGVIGDLIRNLVDLAGPIIGSVIDAVRGLIEIVTGIFSWDIDKVKAGVVTLAEGILGVLRGVFVDLPGVILNALASLGGLLVEFIASLGPVIVNAFTSAWNWVVENGPGILVAVGEWLMGLPGMILGWLGNLGVTLLGWLGSAITFLVSGAGTVLGGLFDFVTGIPGMLLNALGAGLSFLLDFVEQAIIWVAQNGPGILGGLFDFVTGIPGTIIGWLSSLNELLVGWITGAWDWVVENGPTILAKIGAWVVGLPGRIIDWLGDLGTSLWHWLQGAFDFVVEKGPSIIQGVIDFFSGLPGRIFDAIKSGLGSAAGAVGDVARSLYNSVVGFLNEKLIIPIKTFTIDFFGPRTPFEGIPLLQTAHTGGVVGTDVGTMYAGAGGLKSDEVPLILQTGEGVLSRDAMSALGLPAFRALLDAAGGLVRGGHPVVGRIGEASHDEIVSPVPTLGRLIGDAMSGQAPSIVVQVYPTYGDGMTAAEAAQLGEIEGNSIADVLAVRAQIKAS